MFRGVGTGGEKYEVPIRELDNLVAINQDHRSLTGFKCQKEPFTTVGIV